MMGHWVCPRAPWGYRCALAAFRDHDGPCELVELQLWEVVSGNDMSHGITPDRHEAMRVADRLRRYSKLRARVRPYDRSRMKTLQPTVSDSRTK